jgi:hypothetical protein
MCVICVCSENVRPTEDQVKRMWNHNDHGGGVAWREGGRIHWKKGITKVEEMIELSQTMPFPFVQHFRIASIGGKKAELTHPFVVPTGDEDHSRSLELSGDTDGTVIFHNGHWSAWDHELFAGCQRGKHQVPRGPWSDSRAMAWLYRYYGVGFLDALPNQRTVVLTPDQLLFGIADGWYKKDGIWFSNGAWDYPTGRWTVCRFSKCSRADRLDSDGRCPAHPMKNDRLQIASGSTQQTTVMGPVRGPQGVDHTQGPFAVLEELAKAELAWGLVPQGFLTKEEARDVCPKSRLRKLRKAAGKIRTKHFKETGGSEKTTLTH